MKTCARFSCVAVAAAVLLVALPAPAAEINYLINFLPEPSSPLADLSWDGMELYQGPGAIGTGFGVAGPGDGELATNSQSAPGLLIETPFVINGLPGSEVNPGGGATTFYDTTLRIIPTASGATKGLMAAGPAQTLVLGGKTHVFQPLGGGEFDIWTTDPNDGSDESQVLLMRGVVEDAVISGVQGKKSGGVLSVTVSYHGGAIVEAARDALGTGDNAILTGELSLSLLNIDPALAVDQQTGNIESFDSDVTGQFIMTPEPAAATLLGIGAMFMALRRRRQRA